MVTEDSRRWPVGLHGTPARFGKLLEYANFDATFFAVHGKQASARAPRFARKSAAWPILCACRVAFRPILATQHHDWIL